MAKHKHYEMIVAMAANTDLVLFAKFMDEWQQANMQDLLINESFEQYFVCLPIHKEVCLYWLNGGDIQGEDPNKQHSFDDYAPFTDRKTWSCTSWYMRNDRKTRIKPKKEARWIAVKKQDHTVEGVVFLSLNGAEKYCPSDAWTHHRIEVEV